MKTIRRVKESKLWQWFSTVGESIKLRFQKMQENYDLYMNMLKILLGFIQVITFLFLYAI